MMKLTKVSLFRFDASKPGDSVSATSGTSNDSIRNQKSHKQAEFDSTEFTNMHHIPISIDTLQLATLSQNYLKKKKPKNFQFQTKMKFNKLLSNSTINLFETCATCDVRC